MDKIQSQFSDLGVKSISTVNYDDKGDNLLSNASGLTQNRENE